MQSMYNGRIDKRVLSIRKGMELQVNISTDILDSDSVMYQTYCQTLRALLGIVKQTKMFYDACELDRISEEQLDEYLFPFSSNIIAFSGSRGIGKTRTMLSVSGFLQKGKRERSDALKQMDRGNMKVLSSMEFTVIPPISPSVLEEKQNILYVILTRLYRFAEERLKVDEIRNNRNYSQRREKLWRAFQDCYSGINGLKNQNQEKHGDLMELQDLRDGLILRRHFFNLITTILNTNGRGDSFLVLQLDDADSQVENGYEVLEDVRKYLQIPNLVILMSTDVEMLQNVILQDYLEQFPDQKQNVTFKKELMKSCRKYIDKLIPPSYMIHLPTLHELLQYYSNIELDYSEGDGVQIYPWAKDMDLQDTILMEIYRKTGVLFVRPKNYVHYIVPTTIRGLNQLLYMLSRMKELPMLESRWENFTSAENLVEALSGRIRLEDENLQMFSDYFTEGWVKVKVVHEGDQHFLKTLSEESGRVYVQSVVEYLYERYYDSPILKNREKHYSQPFLDRLMADLSENHVSQDDNYLLFSIRTIFTLNHHKMVLRQKRDSIRKFDKLKRNVREMPRYFAIDYDPEVTFLPRTYLVNEKIRKLNLGNSQTFARQHEQYKQSIDDVDSAKMQVGKAEKNGLALQEELDASKKRTQDLERAIRDLTRNVTEAERNVLARQKSAEETDLQMKLLQSEMRALLDDGEKSLYLQKLERAKILKDEMDKRVDRAKEQLSKENERVQDLQEQHRALVHGMRDIKKCLDQTNSEVSEGKKKLTRLMENCQMDFEQLSQIACMLDVDWEPSQENAAVHPVFRAPKDLAARLIELHTAEPKGMLESVAKMKSMFCECMVNKCADESGIEVNFMNFINFILRIGYPGTIGVQKHDVDATLFQHRLYAAQECALLVACNWDVQDAVYGNISWPVKDTKNDGLFRLLYRAVDNVLTQSINDGKVYDYHINCCEEQFKEMVWTDNGWGIVQGYDLFNAENLYSILPQVDREKLLKYVIFDLETPKKNKVPDIPNES